MRGCHAFSLVEMLAVVAIVVTMMGMLGLGMAQLTAQSARKSAVNLVMNTFEQARLAALRSGASAYIVFADEGFPADKRFRSFLVLRERTESDSPPASDASASPYVVLSKWKQLPRGISIADSLPVNSNVLDAAEVAFPVGALPQVTGVKSLPVIQFNQTGAIAKPTALKDKYLYLYEGYHDGTRDVRTLNSTSDLFEAFSFARFTGRIRHEVTSLN